MQIGKLTIHGPYLKMFIYGFTGAGKTHFAGTALDMVGSWVGDLAHDMITEKRTK
ncbi:MAG TPA: hypothetical protein VM537_12220 [Anaerolineae bacterium]|nr:hypothetical protein [Anaerolineae bacterium]